MPPWIEYFAVAVCAISGVLAAEGKRMDLFGAMVLALVQLGAAFAILLGVSRLGKVRAW